MKVLADGSTFMLNRTITRDPIEYLIEYMRAKLNTEEGTEQYQLQKKQYFGFCFPSQRPFPVKPNLFMKTV
jgi:hypothetical protein